MTRILTALLVIFALALPADAQRPRPLAWAMDAVRAGNWDNAAQIAARDGEVASDIIEWMRLRNGGGEYADVRAFLDRRTDWPGEEYLRKRAEPLVIDQTDNEILAFFTEMPPQTPRGVLANAAALTRAGDIGDAEANVVLAWRTMPMNATSQALFLSAYEGLLKPHHAARLDEMLWQREQNEARQMFDLVDKVQIALAETRIALQNRAGDVNTLIAALPASVAGDAGLAHDRFEWRIRKNLVGDAKTLLLERSASIEALGQPSAWSNRRRALARGEMRSGDPKRAYAMASQHFLTSGSDYADLEWLSGYIALRFLKDPELAYQHFLNHDNVV
ncbi:MAG: lytic transglycosylase domain-containing protein, partial [Sulfitobacter sp.]